MKRPRRQGLAFLAVDVLDGAFDEARLEPIHRTPLHRLALGYLLFSGCANASQVRTLWRCWGTKGSMST